MSTLEFKANDTTLQNATHTSEAKNASDLDTFYCQECGRKFATAAAAERAAFSDSGCPGCGGSDIDIGNPKEGQAKNDFHGGGAKDNCPVCRVQGVELDTDTGYCKDCTTKSDVAHRDENLQVKNDREGTPTKFRCSCGGHIVQLEDDLFECEDCGALFEKDDWRPNERLKPSPLNNDSDLDAFYCQECGRKFKTAAAAERAAFSDTGCPGCGGSDIDIGNPKEGKANNVLANSITAPRTLEMRNGTPTGDVQCKECGNWFFAHGSDKKVCSPECDKNFEAHIGRSKSYMQEKGYTARSINRWEKNMRNAVSYEEIYIWRKLADGMPIQELVKDLGFQFGLSPQAALDLIGQARAVNGADALANSRADDLLRLAKTARNLASRGDSESADAQVRNITQKVEDARSRNEINQAEYSEIMDIVLSI